MKQHISTGLGELPGYRKQLHAMSEEHPGELKILLQSLTEKGFIIASSSPIAAPGVEKGSTDVRPVIDVVVVRHQTGPRQSRSRQGLQFCGLSVS